MTFYWRQKNENSEVDNINVPVAHGIRIVSFLLSYSLHLKNINIHNFKHNWCIFIRLKAHLSVWLPFKMNEMHYNSIYVILGREACVFIDNLTSYVGWNFLAPSWTTQLQVGQVVSQRPDKDQMLLYFLSLFIFICRCPVPIVSLCLASVLVYHILIGMT